MGKVAEPRSVGYLLCYYLPCFIRAISLMMTCSLFAIRNSPVRVVSFRSLLDCC